METILRIVEYHMINFHVPYIEETEIIDNDTINQCAECPAICERKFARFMRLLMQHVDAGAGNSFQSEDFFRRNA